MRKLIISGLAAAALGLCGPALAADEQWKDGVLFAENEVASLNGHTAYKITFGLEPGKCTGELTTVGEWLKMIEGSLVQIYPGSGDVARNVGDEWYHESGTRVEVCNRGEESAVLVGVQFRPN
jgi:hypothetical protein